MNFFLAFLKVLPGLLAGVEQVAVDAQGATKKQAVIDGLGLAAGAVTELAPQFAAQAQGAATAVATLIDPFVGIFNTLGIFHHKAAVAQ